ncbi:RNA polymerase sigma factor [Chitinophaga sp. sic0106]|uniref:RNA polymerase sigma factor n=1 Tax=Chitinophaga sp. sic0106 TaxID=2854785 RepID=UPI001C47FCDB|nr:RNA polymerase sigma-70 factor [Chitinophaga sp. sic0106]
MSGKFDERKLLSLLAEGSEYAFTELFSRYRSRVYTLAFRFLQSEAAAEEVVQDVFLKLWLKRQELPHVLQLDPYLRTITKNLVLNRFRKLANEAAAHTELGRRNLPVNDTDQRLLDHQYQDILRAALDTLPPQQREVYRLAREAGMSHADIALQMGISTATVKSHMARALQQIRKYLSSSMSILLIITQCQEVIKKIF